MHLFRNASKITMQCSRLVFCVSEQDGFHRDGHDDTPVDTGHNDGPAIVIYMVNPFSYGKASDPLNRLAIVGLLKCYQEIIPKLPEFMQNSVYLQVRVCLLTVEKS